jgi:hypothetical protein
MKIYTIYTEPNKDINDSKFITEGFSLLALLLPIVWSIYKRIWWLAGLLLIINFLLGVLTEKAIITESGLLVMSLIINLIVAFFASDIYQYELKRKGLIFSDIISACSLKEAQLKLFLKNFNSRN